MYEYWEKMYLNIAWEVQDRADSYRVYRYHTFRSDVSDFNDKAEWALIGETNDTRYYDDTMRLIDIIKPGLAYAVGELWYRVYAVVDDKETLIYTVRKYPRFAAEELEEPEIVELVPIDNGIAVTIDPHNKYVPISHIEIERVYRLHDPVTYPIAPHYSPTILSRQFQVPRKSRRIFDTAFYLPFLDRPRSDKNYREFYVQIGYRIRIVTAEGLNRMFDPFENETKESIFLYMYPYETNPNVHWSMKSRGLINISGSELVFMWHRDSYQRDEEIELWGTKLGTVEEPGSNLFYTLPAKEYVLGDFSGEKYKRLASSSSPEFDIFCNKTWDWSVSEYRIIPITYNGELVFRYYGKTFGGDPTNPLPYQPSEVSIMPFMASMSARTLADSFEFTAYREGSDLEIHISPLFHPWFKKYEVRVRRRWDYDATGDWEELYFNDYVHIDSRYPDITIEGAEQKHLQTSDYDPPSLDRNPSSYFIEVWAHFYGLGKIGPMTKEVL